MQRLWTASLLLTISAWSNESIDALSAMEKTMDEQPARWTRRAILLAGSETYRLEP